MWSRVRAHDLWPLVRRSDASLCERLLQFDDDVPHFDRIDVLASVRHRVEPGDVSALQGYLLALAIWTSEPELMIVERNHDAGRV